MVFKINHYYSFSTIAASVLGQEHKRLKLIAMGDYKTACSYDDIDAKSANLAPYLSTDGSAIDPLADTYLIFTAESGQTLVFALSWINQDTISHSSSQIVHLSIADASATDAERIRQILALAGYNRVTSRIESLG